MKKFISFLLVVVILGASFGDFSTSAYASEGAISSDFSDLPLSSIEYLKDGGFIETRIGEVVNPIQTYGTVYSKTAYKVKTSYTKDGEMNWQFYIYGTFTINPGVSSTCTNDWYTYSVNSPWSLESASSHHSAIAAIGNAKFVRKFLFIVRETNNVSMDVSCDKNGNIK